MVADVPAFIWLSCPTGQRRPEGTCAGNHVRLEGKQHNTSTGGVPDARADATVRRLHGGDGRTLNFEPHHPGAHSPLFFFSPAGAPPKNLPQTLSPPSMPLHPPPHAVPP